MGGNTGYLRGTYRCIHGAAWLILYIWVVHDLEAVFLCNVFSRFFAIQLRDKQKVNYRIMKQFTFLLHLKLNFKNHEINKRIPFVWNFVLVVI